MKINLDRVADALYIESQDVEFGSNKKIDANTIIDLDKKGNLIGMGLLNIGKTIQSLSDITVHIPISRWT